MRSSRRLAFAVIIAVPSLLAVGAAGCGSSSSDDTGVAQNDGAAQDSTTNGDSSAADASSGDSASHDGGPGRVYCATGGSYTDPDGSVHPNPAQQVFSTTMAGCPGSVFWNARDSLCAPTCRSCTAPEWVAQHGTTAPAYHYWTSDDLGWSGGFALGDVCYASQPDAGRSYCSSAPIIIDGGYDGGDSGVFDGGLVDSGETPMRVCAPAEPGTSFEYGQLDSLGNKCNWVRCAYGTTAEIPDAGPDADLDAEPILPFDYMGGCDSDYTAGTLCCCP